MTYFEVVALCVFWALFGWFLRGEHEVYRQSRRSGGYVKQPASSNVRAVANGGSTTRLIRADFSSSTPLGDPWVASGALHLLDPWSRRVAPISSGSGTADRGGNGPTRPEPADSARGADLLRRNRGDDAA